MKKRYIQSPLSDLVNSYSDGEEEEVVDLRFDARLRRSALIRKSLFFLAFPTVAGAGALLPPLCRATSMRPKKTKCHHCQHSCCARSNATEKKLCMAP